MLATSCSQNEELVSNNEKTQIDQDIEMVQVFLDFVDNQVSTRSAESLPSDQNLGDAIKILENSLNIRYSNQHQAYQDQVRTKTSYTLTQRQGDLLDGATLKNLYRQITEDAACRLIDLNRQDAKLHFFDVYDTGEDDNGSMTIGVNDVVGLDPINTIANLKTTFETGEDYDAKIGDCTNTGDNRAVIDISNVLNNLAFIDNVNSAGNFGFLNVERVGSGSFSYENTVYELSLTMAGWVYYCLSNDPDGILSNCNTIDPVEKNCVTYDEMNQHLGEFRSGINIQSQALNSKTNVYNVIYYDNGFNDQGIPNAILLSWEGFYYFGNIVTREVFMNEDLKEVCP